jgi:hypothetical protein
MLVWLEASPVRLGSYPATAKFEFEVGKNYLSSVDVVVADSVSRESAYQNLRQALIEKYDKPISEDLTRGQNTFGDRSEQRTVQWRLKSSMIVLTWYELGGFGYVGVRYSERRAEENL